MHRRPPLRGSWMCPDPVILELWSLIRHGVLDLSVLDVQVVGLGDPAAAIAAARSRGLEIVVLNPNERGPQQI